MAKLPVNFLLYTLYLGSVGLIGGIGWTFYSTYKLKERISDPAFRKETGAEVDKLIKMGQQQQPLRKNWRYDTEVVEWWKQFHKVNMIGKLPPEPVAEAPKVEEAKPVVDTGIPIENIVVLESLLLEVSKAPNQATQVVVRYKPGVEVRPPPDMVATAAAPGGKGWSPGDVKPPSGPTPPASAIPMPTGGQTEMRQFVRLGETLWPPHDNLRLDALTEDGQTAYFLREDPKKDRADWKRERLDKNELELDPTVVKTLRDEQRRLRGEESAPANGTGTPPDPALSMSEWRDPPETREVAPRQVHLSRQDHDYMRDNIDKVLNQDLAVNSYKSRVGNYEGLRIERMSPRLAQFGLQPGDVVLSVNGEKVKSKQQAYGVGKRQYEAGARAFRVEVLSGRGTGVETRTITLPKN